jgi:hypothetical protein
VIEYICKKLLKFFDYISEDKTALEIAECVSRWSSMSYGGNIEAILIWKNSYEYENINRIKMYKLKFKFWGVNV